MADLDLDSSGQVSTKELVVSKFNATMDAADDMILLLTGESGNSGYLGALANIINELPNPGDIISVANIAVPDFALTVDNRPAVDVSGLDTDFPIFDATMGSLLSIPTVDISTLDPGTLPVLGDASLNWAEITTNSEIYTPLLAQLLSDLSSGAGGLGGTIEQDIYDRALARQLVDNDRAYEEVDNLYSGQRWDLPSGAYVAAIEEVSAKISARNLDLNIEILKDQAELAQKNQQFVLSSLQELEKLLIDKNNQENIRALDYAKSVATNVLTVYSEGIKGYVASAEAKKLYVEVQVENLKAIIEYNKAIVSEFAAEASAYSVIVDAKAKKNSAYIGAIEAEISGYDSETKAIAANQDSQVKGWQLKINNAELALKAAIAKAEETTKGYVAEYSLREKVAEALANIAMQATASAYGAVNASAGVSASWGDTISKSYDQTKEISEGLRESISTNYSHDATKGIDSGASTSHAHYYDEK